MHWSQIKANKQTTSSNSKWYYLVNLLQFLCHTYHLQTKVMKKLPLKPAIQPWNCDASKPISAKFRWPASHQLSKPADKGPQKSACGLH